MGGSAESLRIFPTDNSRISLPFDNKYTINKSVSDDDDFKDLYMLRIDLEDFNSSSDSQLVAQDIEVWIYPSEKRFIDYENYTIRHTRVVLRATYNGHSISEHCHMLNVDSSVKLDNFDGLSGSPVYYMLRNKEDRENGEAVDYPLFVGIVIRGTETSSTMHFISSDVIANFIRCAETT